MHKVKIGAGLAVAAAPAGGNVWAVGYSGASGSFNPLALQASG